MDLDQDINPALNYGERLGRNIRLRRNDLAVRLKLAREDAMMSQYQVARTLNWRQEAISRMESGRRRIDAVELETLAMLYGKTLADFATWDRQHVKDNLKPTVRLLFSEVEQRAKRRLKEIRNWQKYGVSKRSTSGKLGPYPPYPAKKSATAKP